jgi:hypothetical protein
VLPIVGDEGLAEAVVDVDYNATHGDVTGVALILYGLDSQLPEAQWHVLDGADPETLEVEKLRLRPVSGNSLSRDGNNRTITLASDVIIPAVDPEKPETDIQFVTFLLVEFGKEITKVPPDPLGSDFGVPLDPTQDP